MSKKIIKLIYNIFNFFVILILLLYILLLYLEQSHNLYINNLNIILYITFFIIFSSLLFFFIKNKNLFYKKNDLKYIIQFIFIFLIIASLILVSLYFYIDYKTNTTDKLINNQFFSSLLEKINSKHNKYVIYDYGLEYLRLSDTFITRCSLDRITLMSFVYKSENITDLFYNINTKYMNDLFFAVRIVGWMGVSLVTFFFSFVYGEFLVCPSQIQVATDLLCTREPIDLVPIADYGYQYFPMTQHFDLTHAYHQYFIGKDKLLDTLLNPNLDINNLSPNSMYNFYLSQPTPVFFLDTFKVSNDFTINNDFLRLSTNYLSFLRKQVNLYDLELMKLRCIAKYVNLIVDQPDLNYRG